MTAVRSSRRKRVASYCSFLKKLSLKHYHDATLISRSQRKCPNTCWGQSRKCKEGSLHSNWSLHSVYEGFATNSAKRVVLGKADIGSFDLGRIKLCAGFMRVRDVASRSLAHSLTRRGGLLRISPSWRSCVAPPSEIGGLFHANAVE